MDAELAVVVCESKPRRGVRLRNRAEKEMDALLGATERRAVVASHCAQPTMAIFHKQNRGY